MEKKITNAMELINAQKEDIAKRKNQILVAETRRNDNTKLLEEEKKKVVDLGYDPEKIDEVLSSMEMKKQEFEKEIDDIILELEGMNSI